MTRGGLLFGLLAAICIVAMPRVGEADNLLIQAVPAAGRAAETATPGDSAAFRVFGDWQVACRAATGGAPTSSGSCVMEPIARAYSGSPGVTRLYGQMIALKPRSKAVPVLIVETRLGYLLPQGIGLKIDRRTSGKLAIRNCQLSGCVAPFQLTSTLRRRMTRGSTLELSLNTLDAKTDLTSVSLSGFPAALEALMTDGKGLAATGR